MAKVKFTKDYKSILTVEEYEQGKRVIEYYKDFDEPEKDIAESIAQRNNIGVYRFIFCERTIGKNRDIPNYNYWGSDTGFMDIQVHACVYGFRDGQHGYFELYMNLSELYSGEGKAQEDNYIKGW